MGCKRYDGCIICVLFQISWQLQTQIVKNRMLSDSLLGITLYVYILSVHFQVHVARHKVEVYNQIQEFQDNFTSDGSSTQIHACGKEVILVHKFR